MSKSSFLNRRDINTNGPHLFRNVQRKRSTKRGILEPAGVFKSYGIEKVQELTTPLIEMDTLSLNYWLAKFVQEVAKPHKERYPPKTIYQLVCFLRRYIAEKNPGDGTNFLDSQHMRLVILCIFATCTMQKLCLYFRFMLVEDLGLS